MFSELRLPGRPVLYLAKGGPLSPSLCHAAAVARDRASDARAFCVRHTRTSAACETAPRPREPAEGHVALFSFRLVVMLLFFRL